MKLPGVAIYTHFVSLPCCIDLSRPELIAECPFIPKDAKVKYNSKDVGKCVYIITAGGSIKKKRAWRLYGRIDYSDCLPKFPTGQWADDKRTGSSGQHYRVAGGYTEPPRLTGNRTITKDYRRRQLPGCGRG